MKITNYELRITNKKKQRGFTLIETIVAVLILSIALNGILTLITSNIFSAQYAKNEITAMYLAQEAIDRIRNDRDSMAFHSNGNWNAFLNRYGYNSPDLKCFDTTIGCQIDTTDWILPNNITDCGVSSCDPFYYDDNSSTLNTKYYSYTAIDKKLTSFRRKIIMRTKDVAQGVTLTSNEEVVVTVTVDWLNGNSPKSRTLTTSLLKWR